MWSILVRKLFGGVCALSPGCFLSRVGPSIQLGASVGQGCAGGFKLRGTVRRCQLSSGSAAGCAAAFNAPMSGLCLLLEEVYHNFSPLVVQSACAGAMCSDFISLNVLSLVPVCHCSYSRSYSVQCTWHCILLGICLGCLGYCYQRMYLAMPRVYQRSLHCPRAIQGVFPFMLLMAVGTFTPNLLCGGNSCMLCLCQYVPSLLVLCGIL